jgi:type IV pilus assembly protein PilO
MKVPFSVEKVYPYIEKVPERFRFYILVGVSLLLSLLYLFLIRFPATDKLAQLRKEYEGVHREYLEKKAIADNLQNWQMEVAKLRALLQESLARLPTEVEKEEFLIQLPNMAKKAGLIEKEFSQGGDRPKGDYAEVPFSMKFVGTYNAFGLFAQEVAEQPRIMTVGSFKMKSRGKSGGQEVLPAEGVPLDIEVEVLTYKFLTGGPKK